MRFDMVQNMLMDKKSVTNIKCKSVEIQTTKMTLPSLQQ